MAMAANAVLLGVKLSFYFRIFKPYRESFKKHIIASVIIANTIPNLIKYLVVLEDLPECVQVGQTTLKCRPDKRNLRPPHHISPSLSHFDLTPYLTFHYKFIKSIQNQFKIRCPPL